MKKKLAALLLSLLLACSLSAIAYADVTYIDLGDVEVGTSINHHLATVAIGSTVNVAEGTVPPGCQISTEDTPDGLNIYLSGTPNTAGSYNCTIDFGNNKQLICPIDIIAGKPAVVSSPDVVADINDILDIFVKASVNGGGNLSYQWYVSPTNSTNGQLISGATGPTYRVDTSVAGENYYYCIVSNSTGNHARSTVSNPIRVMVQQVSAQAIYLNTPPTVVEYVEGDTLDTSGLSIRVEFADGSSQIVTGGFDVYPSTLTTAGSQQIQINYLNHSCTFNVKVEAEEEIIEGIGVLTLPAKTRYEMGESLDTKGLSIKVYTNKGEQTVTDGLSCVPSVFNYSGKQTVTVRYMGKSCTFTVEVNEPEVPLRIDVASRANKLDYTVGESLDISGLIIRVTGSNGSSNEVRSGFSCEPTVLDTAGKQKITVTYEGMQCTYYVNVAANPSATARPTVTPSPGNSPAPTVSPRPTVDPGDHQPYDTGMNNKLIVVIMIIALVIMAALCGFVFVMQRGGIKNIFRNFRR